MEVLFTINGNLSGELLVNFPMESVRNSFQNQRKLVWRESLRNSFQNQWKLVRRALGRLCSYGILVEFLSKSMEIGLESSWSMSQWNTQGIPFKINGNLSGENPYGIHFKINGNSSWQLLVNFSIESLWNSFQNQWKLAWRGYLWNSFQNQWKLVLGALRQYPNVIHKEFLSISMEIGLESPWSISQWNP